MENIEYQVDLEPDNEVEDDTVKNKYLTFIVDDEVYGLDIGRVIEIISVPAITWIPENPEAIKGIINLRGSIIPAIDVRLRFQKEERPYDTFTCIIVIEHEHNQIGLIVDTINEVLYIPKKYSSSPPNAKLKYENRFVKTIGKVNDTVQLLLDLDKFLYS